MEKKIEVEINGRTVRIMPHMLADSVRFGASEIKRQTRKVPDELLSIPAKKILAPEVKPAPNLDAPTSLIDSENAPEIKPDLLADVKMENAPKTAAKTTTKKAVKRNTKKK